MPSTDELLGGFWAGASPVVDDYARAAFVLETNAVGYGRLAPVRAWTVRADEAEVVTVDGVAATAYPLPPTGEVPVWVATSPDAAAALAAGVDFVTDAERVFFFEDPLAATTPYPVWDGGTPVAAVDLWYAPAAPVAAATPDPQGSLGALVRAVAAACDSPCSGAAAEMVAAVYEGADGGWRVVTDGGAYRLAAADVPAVAVGDVLAPLSPLGTAWALTRLGPALPALDYLTTPATFHQAVTAGGVTWYDAEVPLVVDEASGRTRVRFALGATADDLAAFWAASHARGVANGRTLAQALDTRADPTGDPGPESLPTVINPLAFVCRELLAGCAWLLLVRPARFGSEAASTAERQAAVRLAAGPQTAVFEYEDEMPAIPELSPV